MNKAFKYRIYPTKDQEEFLMKEFGLCRVVWNSALNAKKQNMDKPIPSYLESLDLYNPEARLWLKEVFSYPVSQSLNRLGETFKQFFASRKGKRKGKPIGFPKFKSRKDTQSALICGPTVKFKNGKLDCGRKLGPLAGKFHRFAEGQLKSCTISKTPTGKWYASVLVECKSLKIINNNQIIGIDWNCRDDCFLTLSNGTKIKCPRWLKHNLSRLGREQKRLSRKTKDSNNYNKQRIKVAKIHERVAAQRQDWLHKISRTLANMYEYIVVEDINLQTMSKMNHGKVVGDQGFGMLRQFLAYKTNLIKVRAAYTSKTCSNCGYVNEEIVVGIENWDCPMCHTHHDRDINASQNILLRGQEFLRGEPADVKPVDSKVTKRKKQEVSVACDLTKVI